MAAGPREVKKDLVLAAVDVFFDYEPKEIETDVAVVRSGLAIKFTDERAPTQMGAVQGDHVTAYSLYVEFVMRLIDRYILAAKENNFSGLSNLLREMKSRPLCDNFLLICFNLTPVTLDDFQQIDLNIEKLRNKYNERLMPLLKNINIMQSLKNSSLNTNIPKEILAYIQELDPDSLKAEINAVRSEYFYIIAQKIATEYLLFQNKAPHVTFRKVSGYEPDSGEGGYISSALRKLREYNNYGIVPQNIGAQPSGRIILTRNSTTASTHTSIDNTKKDIVREIVQNISTLLFYPKIDEENVVSTTKKDAQRGVLRSNDPRLFCFVIARHLSVVFATFEEFGKEPQIKDAIIDQFIELKAKEWGYNSTFSSVECDIDKIKEKFINRKTGAASDDAALGASNSDVEKFIEDIENFDNINQIKIIIKAALKATESVSYDFIYEGGVLDASVIDSSPSKQLSTSISAAMMTTSNQSSDLSASSSNESAPTPNRKKSGGWDLLSSSFSTISNRFIGGASTNQHSSAQQIDGNNSTVNAKPTGISSDQDKSEQDKKDNTKKNKRR